MSILLLTHGRISFKYARDGKFLNLTVIPTGDAALPGFGLLFEEREHLLQMIHLSLREFLLDVERSREYAADVRRGHVILTKSCLQILLERTTGPTLAYALRHGHVHLTDVLSRFGRDGRKDRDSAVVLQQWFGAFLEPRFGGKSVAEAEVRAVQHEAAQQQRRRTQLETQAAARKEARRKRLCPGSQKGQFQPAPVARAATGSTPAGQDYYQSIVAVVPTILNGSLEQ